MKVRFTFLASAFALSVALLSGCQSGDSGQETIQPAPQAGGGVPGPGGAAEPMPGGPAPAMPVAPAGGGTAKVAKGGGKGPATSFDGAPDGMPGMVPGGGGGGAPLGGAPGAGATQTAMAKPAPIVEGRMSKFRPDPFVSFVRLVIQKPPAYTLAIPDRLAALPKPPPPPPVTNPNEMLPLPQVPRRVAGVLYNGAITAILETGTPPASETRIIAPGAKVPSGVPGIPDLTVDSIALDRLVLRAEDGRTVEVKLSGLAPAVLQSMQGQFGGTGGGGMMGGGMPGPGAGGLGGPPGAGGAADLK
ncbi:MAG: hypothetical protein QM758_15270 [Armatimonas sp.]